MADVDVWMPLYWGDYLRDTAHLSAAEHGAYLLLIGHYWTTGRALPDDDEQLRRIARMERSEWKQSRSTIAAFFDISDGAWVHKRIEEELTEWTSRKQTYKERASTAARKRWASNKDASSIAPSNASSTPKRSPRSIASGNRQDVLGRCPSPSPYESPIQGGTDLEVGSRRKVQDTARGSCASGEEYDPPFDGEAGEVLQ